MNYLNADTTTMDLSSPSPCCKITLTALREEDIIKLYKNGKNIQ